MDVRLHHETIATNLLDRLGQKLMALLGNLVNDSLQRLGFEPTDVFMNRLLSEPRSR